MVKSMKIRLFLASLFVAASATLASAQLAGPPINYSGGVGSGGGGGSCTGSFCSATAPLSATLGGNALNNSASTGIPLWTAGVQSILSTTGTGNVVRATSPTLTTPALGTPSAIVLTNGTGLVATTGLTATGTKNSTTFLRGDDTWAVPSGGGSPGGSTTQVQYNNAGSFGGITGFTSDGTSGTFGSGNLKLSGASSGTVVLNAPSTGGGTLTLPAGTDTIVSLTATQTLTNKTLTSPTLTTPVLGTPSSGNASNLTNIPVAQATGVLPAANGGAGTVNGVLTANGSGTVSAATMGACLTYSSGTVAGTYTINAQTGTTYTVLSSDACKLVTFSNASAVAVTLPQATGSFAAGFSFDVQNKGAGAVTITPTTSTINGGATLVVNQNTGCSIVSDGTNYQVSACTAIGASSGTVTSVALSAPSNAACSVSGSPVTTSGTLTCTPSGTSGGVPYFSSSSALSSSAALATNALVIGGGAGAAPATTTTGSGVLTALASAPGANGGFSTTIASGTSALGTSAISSGACATVVTTSATGTATTDIIMASFNADPTSTTGYQASANGMLTIIAYPTANNVNFKVCNNTASSITPGAVTLNWRVIR